MKKSIITILLLLLMLPLFAQQSANTPTIVSDDQFVEQSYYPATQLLYRQDVQGGMHFLCTATAFEKDSGLLSDTYRFVTASHCVGDKGTEVAKGFFYVATDGDNKSFLKAKVVARGDEMAGDDYAVVEVHTREKFPIVPLGNDPTSVAGEPVMNVAAPMGLGKQTFQGRITSPRVDRPMTSEDQGFDWTGDILVQLYGTNGGSSGSTIVCVRQRAVCGFLIGIIGGTTEVAAPISRFKKFWAAEKAKNYKPVSPITGQEIKNDGTATAAAK